MMECCSMGESERPLTIISEENRLRGGRPRRHSPLLDHHASSSSRSPQCAELVTAVSLPRHHDQSEEECTITASVSVAALPSLTPHGGHCSPPARHHHGSGSASQVVVDAALSPSASSEQSLGSEMSATAEEQTSFSKEVISFSLFGRIHPKCKRPWNESLSARIAQVQDCYKNIPPKLYFSPSSVSFEGIGVYAAEPLPQDASLGPYIGHHVSREQIDGAEHNEWLWEVYESSSLAYFVDASDPKLSNHNWMNFIQCARNSNEQNLKLTQIDNNLYFMATRDVSVGEELLVWYDEVQYGVYMGLPTGFNETREPIIEKAAMEPGAAAASTQQHSAAAPTLTTALYATPGQTTVAHHVILTRNPSEHRLYNNIPNYTSAPSSAGNLSDSADSGISLSASLEQSGGGPTPLGAVGAAATTTTTGLTSSSFDRASNCSGSSTHLDMTSMSSSNKQAASVEPFHHLPPHGMQEVPVTAYHTGELYGSFHIIPATATGSAALSQHPASAGVAVIGGGASPHWITTAGRVTGAGGGGGGKPGVDLTTGDVWLKTPTVGIAQPISIGGSTEGLGNRKQLLYGMFSRYEDGTRWQCEQCKKLFSSQGSLRAHARIHTGERPYQCQYCSRTFCQASTLRSHERLHTGEKPYKCEHCGRAFTQSAGLRSHLKTHRYDSL